ncbi:MAG: disulfide bond formation protein DsbD, partial [Acidobacteriales bacterium]|nr:disulfide bond formation protein DsbD [Terriglobales bacterium]
MTRVLLLWLVAACAAAAQTASPSAKGEHLQVTLVSEDRQVAADEEFWVGLDFRLEPGWHVYWINPGDSGQAPTVKWGLPKGVVAGDIQWPKPERIAVASLVDYGYSDRVLFMAPMHADESVKGRLPISADVHWLVCREVCIPGKAQLGITLPVGKAEVDPEAHQLFEHFRKLVPESAPSSWQTASKSSGDEFVLDVKTGARETNAQFFPLQELQIDNAAQQRVTAKRDG